MGARNERRPNSRWRKVGSTKSKIRNEFEAGMSESARTSMGFGHSEASDFEFVSSFEFRASDFGLVELRSLPGLRAAERGASGRCDRIAGNRRAHPGRGDPGFSGGLAGDA